MLDHPFNTTPFLENFPQPVDTTAFQKEIDTLFGREPITGRSWLRLVWMPSSKVDDIGWPETYDWNEYGDGGRGMWRRRYLYSADKTYLDMLDDQTGLWYSKEVWSDVAPPRFGLESFIPPQFALDGWRHSGYDSDGDRFTSRRPVHGLYQPMFIPKRVSTLLQGGMFAVHDHLCCKNAKENDVQCYGYYQEPSREHLDELRRLRYQKENEEKERRVGYATTAEFDNARRRRTLQHETYWEKFGERLQQITAEALKTHKASLSDDPSVQKNGIWHFMGGSSKSGLTVPERDKMLARNAVKSAVK